MSMVVTEVLNLIFLLLFSSIFPVESSKKTRIKVKLKMYFILQQKNKFKMREKPFHLLNDVTGSEKG
jgi:hypothetical protein